MARGQAKQGQARDQRGFNFGKEGHFAKGCDQARVTIPQILRGGSSIEKSHW